MGPRRIGTDAANQDARDRAERRSWRPAGTDRAEAERLARQLAAKANGPDDGGRALSFGALWPAGGGGEEAVGIVGGSHFVQAYCAGAKGAVVHVGVVAESGEVDVQAAGGEGRQGVPG